MRWIILIAATCCWTLACASTDSSPSEKMFASALQAIDACTARLDREIDVGYERIAARCPELSQRLSAAGVDRWLPGSWHDPHNDLSAGGLEELRTALERERAVAAISHTPRSEALKTTLLQMGSGAHERAGVWRRFLNWLRALVSARGQPQGPGLLSRLVSRIGLPETLIQILTYAAFGVMLALAFVILANELRAAGILQSLRRRGEDTATAVAAGHGELQWEDVEHAAQSERPRLLLTLILERLTRLRVLPPARSLTIREVTRALQRTDIQDAHRVAQLAAVAERVRYAASPVSLTDLEQALATGRALMQTLAVWRSSPHPP
jgi:hypothetical protein